MPTKEEVAKRKERLKQAMRMNRKLIKEVGEMVGDSASDEAWEAVAELDIAYNFDMVAWVFSGTAEALTKYKASHEALAAAWEKFGDS